MSDYIATRDEVRDAYRAQVRKDTDKRYLAKGREPLTDAEIDSEFDRFIGSLQARAWAAGVKRALLSEGYSSAEDAAVLEANPHGSD